MALAVHQVMPQLYAQVGIHLTNALVSIIKLHYQIVLQRLVRALPGVGHYIALTLVCDKTHHLGNI